MIFLLLSSCSPARFCAKRFPPTTDTITQVDTVWTERFVKVGYPADSVDIFVPKIEVDRTQVKPIIRVKKNKQSTVKLTVDSTGIRAEAHCAEKDSIIKLLEREVTRKDKINSVQHIPVSRPIPWFYTWSLYIAIVAVTISIVKIGRLISKLFGA